MLRATIRSNETRQVDVEGEGLEEIQAQLETNRPDGFALVSAPVTMPKASTKITATGTYARRDNTQEIVGETMDDLRSQVPDGWRMLHVIRD